MTKLTRNGKIIGKITLKDINQIRTNPKFNYLLHMTLHFSILCQSSQIELDGRKRNYLLHKRA
jgi:hypothetical protein